MTTCGLLWNDREVCDRKMFEKLHEKLSSEIIISVFVKIRKYECFCNVMYFQTFLLSVKGIDVFTRHTLGANPVSIRGESRMIDIISIYHLKLV